MHRVRLSCLIVLAAVFGRAGLAAQLPAEVLGVMSPYTDNQFGFTFWYPTAWKVTVDPVADPSRDGWFPDAQIVKALGVRNPAGADGEGPPAGVTIEVVVAPAGLTELGRSKSPSPVGVDQRYFFRSATRQWMDAELTEEPTGAPPQTTPIKIKQPTMGGLPMWFGAVRGGNEIIVPLDRTHFLAITTLDPGGYNSHVYLAQTLVATSPAAGNQASERLQGETVRREAVKLMAIGVGIGSWYKSSEHIFKMDGDVLPGANAKTFVLLPTPRSLGPEDTAFATDGEHVYEAGSGLVPGADPKTFVVTGRSTARDAQRVYDWTTGLLKVSSVTKNAAQRGSDPSTRTPGTGNKLLGSS